MLLRAHLGSSQLVFYLNILMLANSSTYFGLCTPVTVSSFMFASLRLTWEDLMSLIQLAHCPEMWVVYNRYNYSYVQHLYPISIWNQNNIISTDLLVIVFSLCGSECISFLSINCLLQFVHNLNKCLDLLNTSGTWTCILRKRIHSQVAIKKLAYWSLLACLLHWMLGYWYMVNAHVCTRYGIDVQLHIPWMVLC